MLTVPGEDVVVNDVHNLVYDRPFCTSYGIWIKGGASRLFVGNSENARTVLTTIVGEAKLFLNPPKIRTKRHL